MSADITETLRRRPGDVRLRVNPLMRLVDINAAAEYCGISPATFERRLVNGPDGPRLRPVRIGNRKLYDLRAIDRWLDGLAGLKQASGSVFDWEAALSGED